MKKAIVCASYVQNQAWDSFKQLYRLKKDAQDLGYRLETAFLIQTWIDYKKVKDYLKKRNDITAVFFMETKLNEKFLYDYYNYFLQNNYILLICRSNKVFVQIFAD